MPDVTVTLLSRFEDQMYGPEHPRVIRRWRITRGCFRAEIPECPCGLRKQTGVKCAPLPPYVPGEPCPPREVVKTYSVAKIECLCDYVAGRCTRATARDRDRRCHGWHQARLDRLVGLLDGKPRKHQLKSPGRTAYRPADLLPTAIDWPTRVSRVGQTPMVLCECEDCTRTAELLIKEKSNADSCAARV